MAAHKVQRTVATVALLLIMLAFLALWLVGWFVAESPGMAEQGFYGFLIFLAAYLVFVGLRASIYE